MGHRAAWTFPAELIGKKGEPIEKRAVMRVDLPGERCAERAFVFPDTPRIAEQRDDLILTVDAMAKALKAPLQCARIDRMEPLGGPIIKCREHTKRAPSDDRDRAESEQRGDEPGHLAIVRIVIGADYPKRIVIEARAEIALSD